MPFAKVNNIRMYYRLFGHGYPLVVVNGLGVDVSEFETITKPLGAGHRVLVFDNRGAGRSDKPDEPYTIEQMADDTRLLMLTTGLHKAAILGISMGGRIALELALSYPAMVSRLVLVSSAARVERSLRRSLIMNIMPRLPIARGRYPQPYFAFARQKQASASYDATSRLNRIRMPTLILHGHSDRTASPQLARELRDGIRGAKLELFPGGHLFFLTRARSQFLQTVQQFVSAKPKR